MQKLSAIVFSLAFFVCPKVLAQSVINISTIAATDTLAAPAQQTGDTHTLTGVIVSQQNELVPGVTVIARSLFGRATCDERRRG
ncbi:MAG: hypothetical protein WKF84_27930 [Pyrinomonadaceae bacterium]